MFSGVFLVLLGVSLFPRSQSQSLEIGKLNALLPTGRSDVRTFYDGDDGVYILGGLSTDAAGHSVYYDQVLRYSITDDEISEAGKLPSSICKGGVGTNGQGSFYYLGGYNMGACSSLVTQLSPENPNATVVATLPRAVHSFATASDGRGNVYLVGGARCSDVPPVSEIVRFDSISGTAAVAGSLPPSVYLSNMPAVWIKGAVYIFGGFDAFSTGTQSIIVKFSPISSDSEILPEELPIDMEGHSAAVAGNYVYLIGGQSLEGVAHHVTRFDSDTETVESVDVINFPSVLNGASSVHVPKTNRIYIFGGNSHASGTDSEEILYIQLE